MLNKITLAQTSASKRVQMCLEKCVSDWPCKFSAPWWYCEEHPHNQFSFPLVRIIGKNALDSAAVHCTDSNSLFKAGWLQPRCICGERKDLLLYHVTSHCHGAEERSTNSSLHSAPRVPFICLHSWCRQTGIQMAYIYLAGSAWALSTAV